MATANTQWILELVDNITKPLKNIDSNIQAVTKDGSKMNQVLTDTSAVNINAIADSFRSLKDRLNEAVEPGIRFQDGLSDVEAITGISGKALESLGLKARESAKIYGGEASDSLENYKILLSKLGPDIGKSEDALNTMNNNVLTLSKSMGGDTTGSVEALTTAMLQYQVDLSDPIKASKEMTDMMHIMAAGAQEGSAEVPQISAALKNAGVAASGANVSFIETNAALQELARGGKVGAEGGVALRNILGKMAGEDVIPQQALDKLEALGVNMDIVSDKTLPFTTRLRELSKARKDSTALAQVFGVENASAADILIRSSDAQDKLAVKITGTSSATEQANVKMATFSERMSRWNAELKDVGISIFNATEGFLPFINGAFGAVDVLADLKNAQQGVSMIMNSGFIKGIKNINVGFKGAAKSALQFTKGILLSGVNALKASGRFVITAVTGIGSFVASIITATAAQLGLNVAMSANPIGLIVIGVAAAIGAIVLLVKYWDEIKAAIWQFTQFILKINPFSFIINMVDKIFPGFKQSIKDLFGKVIDYALAFWEKIKAIGSAIADFFGFGGEDSEISVDGSVDTPNTDGTTPETNPVPNTNPLNTSNITPEIKNANNVSNNSSNQYNQTAKTQSFSITNIFKVDENTINKVEEMADKVVEIVVRKLKDPEIA